MPVVRVWSVQVARRVRLTRVLALCGRGPFWRRLSLLTLAACAVGPDFVAPQAPQGAGYTPEGQPAATASADVAGGAAQKFDMGRDIPGEWWKVFHSKETRRFDGRSLAGQSKSSGGAGGVVAGEGKPVRAERQAIAVDRRQRVGDAPAILAGGIRRRRRAVHFQSVPGDGECLLCAGRIRRPAPSDRIDAGAGRVSAFRT